MKRKLLLAATSLMFAVVGGGGSASAYNVSDLESDGWAKATSLDDASNNYYVFVDAGAQATAMFRNNDSDARPFYNTIVDPLTNLQEVWVIEPNGSNFTIKGNEESFFFNSGNAGWNDYVGHNNDNGNYTFTLSNEKYSIKSVTTNQWVGPWNNDGAVSTNLPENVAANKSEGQAPGFYLYAMSRSAFSEALAAARLSTLSTATKESPVDVSSYIVNANFTSRNAQGWTRTGSAGNQQWSNQTMESWNNNNVSVSQKVVGLPEGLYKVSADIIAGPGINQTAYVFGNNGAVEKIAIATANATEGNYATMSTEVLGKTLTTDFINVSSGELTIGFKDPATGSGWVVVDNFKLNYYGFDLDELKSAYTEALVAAQGIDQKAPMLNTALAALQDALTNYSTCEETKEALTTAANALSSAVAAVNTSIEAYAKAKTAIDAANALKDAHNFASSSAITTFADAIAAISDAYDARTLTDATAAEAGTTLGTIRSGWHGNATGAAGVYMSDAWDNSNDWSDYYINTWSDEGDNDGSGFSVPFFEYWVGSGSLAARTMTGTLIGLKTNQLYKITAEVRVSYSSKVDGSITLTAGDGTPVDVTTGNQIGTTTRYLGTFSAYGKANSEGALTAEITVAENSGISWLCWQNVYYEETNLDISGLNTTITNAQALNAKVTNGVSSLATAIATAESLLASATTQDELDNGVTELESAITAAESIIAARLNLAGVAKKATALKSFIDTDITEEITAATNYANNAEATEAEATAKATALNTYFAEWEEVTLTNADFNTGWNGELIDPGTTAKPYVHAVEGWTQNFKFNSTAAQGIAAEYGSPAQDGTNNVGAPATDMYGNNEGGALHLSSGWSDQARYYQDVALNAGKYVFYYEGINVNNTTNSLNSNYFGIGNLSAGDLDGTNNTFKYADDKSFTYNEWKACAFGFTLLNYKDAARVHVGLIGGTAGSGSTPKMWFDNVKIYRIASSATMEITAAKYATFCAPFDVAIPTGVTAYTVDDATGTTLDLTEVETTIPANKPVLLYSESVVNTPFYGKAIAGTPTEGLLTGVYEATEAPDDSYVLASINNKVAFYQVDNTDKPTVGANRAYLTAPAAPGAKSRAFFFEGDDATAIATISALTSGEVEDIYTVGGAKVNSLQKGINIVKMQNGETKKVIVK